MNEDQVTSLLDRLAEKVEVSHPPVAATADAGRRLLRRRHRTQVGAAATVVVALIAGGVALQQGLGSGEGAATQPRPIHTPSASQLFGSWRPIILQGHPVSDVRHADENLVVLTFDSHLGRLGWGGTDGCNSWGGFVHLGTQGAFRTSDNGSTRKACLPPGEMPFTEVDAILHATRMHLVGERLVLSNSTQARLGVFVPAAARPPHPGAGSGLPGSPPAKHALLGIWRPLVLRGADVSPTLRVNGEPMVISFTNSLVTLPVTTDISWRGYDGCNWTSGWVRLGPAGSFSTRGNGLTLRACIGPHGDSTPGQTFTEVDAVLDAAQVRLVGGDLHFFDAKDQPIGVFAKVQPR